MEARATQELVRAEQAEILATLAQLTDEQWSTPSLCAGWRVRDVAAHLLVDEPLHELGTVTVVIKMIGWRFDVDRANSWWVAHCAAWPRERILEAFERSLTPGRMSRYLGADVQLRAAVIHHLDMTRPLGVERAASAERLRATLDCVMTPEAARGSGRASGPRVCTWSPLTLAGPTAAAARLSRARGSRSCWPWRGVRSPWPTSPDQEPRCSPDASHNPPPRDESPGP